jgi:Zn-finger nucleic acid-binding protein
VSEIRCLKCDVALQQGTVTFEYMDSRFPVELPICPTCGAVFVPEDLAIGKMQQVERMLEDK